MSDSIQYHTVFTELRRKADKHVHVQACRKTEEEARRTGRNCHNYLLCKSHVQQETDRL